MNNKNIGDKISILFLKYPYKSQIIKYGDIEIHNYMFVVYQM